MDHSSFCYWLHGYMELTNGAHPTPQQWETIKDHLELIFNKVTPNRFNDKERPTYRALTTPSSNPIDQEGLLCGGVQLIGGRPVLDEKITVPVTC